MKAKKSKPEFHTAMGRTVFGGGGITPDVELDDVKYPQLVEDLEAKQLFFKYAVKYATKHPEAPAKYAITRAGERDPQGSQQGGGSPYPLTGPWTAAATGPDKKSESQNRKRHLSGKP